MWLLPLLVACLPASRRIPPPPVAPTAPSAEVAAPALAAALTGRVLELRGEPAAALPYYDLALRYNAGDPWLLARRAAVLAVGAPAPALTLWIATPLRDPDALAARGRARFLAGDPDGAMLDLGAALALRQGPASEADLQVYLAAAVQSRRYGEALSRLAAMAAARPGDVGLARVRAQLARDAGDRLALRDALDALARLPGADAALQQERASLCLLLGDPRGALSILGPVSRSSSEEARALAREAKAALKGRKGGAAPVVVAPPAPPDLRIEQLEGRTDLASQLQLAAARAEAGQIDLALATWEAVLAQDPGNPTANLGLAEVLMAGTRPDLQMRALAHARRAADAAPGCAAAWDGLQRAALAADQPAEAAFAQQRVELYSGPWSQCP